LLQQHKFPLTISWRAGEEDHDLVCAASTSADRSAWVKALNAVIKDMNGAAPVAGWLTKQGGRRSGRVAFSRWKRRWFVLSFPHDGREGTFRFYEGVPSDPAMSAKGVVILNRTAQVFEVENKSKDHCFVITSQGVRDKAPISTVLSADSKKEQQQWIGAIRDAINPPDAGMSNKRKSRFITSVRKSQVAAKSMRSVKAKSNRSVQLMQMAKYDRDDLKALKLPVLKEVLEHLDVDFDRKSKDPLYHIDLIVNQNRLLQSAQAFEGGFKAWRKKASTDELPLPDTGRKDSDGLGEMRSTAL